MTNKFYDNYYLNNEWKYERSNELKKFNSCIHPFIPENPGLVVEIGCGLGFHSNLWHSLGFNIIGYDNSTTAIEKASARYPGTKLVQLDVATLADRHDPSSIDIIYCRGMSWYHYELNGKNKYNVDVTRETGKLFLLLKKGGFFILEIITDHSGRRPVGEVHNNTISDYLGLFNEFGICVSAMDWHNRKLDVGNPGRNVGFTGVTLVIRKSGD